MTNAALKISLGISVGFLILLLVGICGLYCAKKRRSFRLLKRKYFEINGGLLMKNVEKTSRIFTQEELMKATHNFDESRRIGERVYRGILSDKTVVAIKAYYVDNDAKFGNEVIAKFVNEVIALSQNNHRNVVRLLGYCLETTTPLFVYEFVSNKGTLYEHIHKMRMRGSSPFSLYWRIKAAAETAAALAYLHSSISKPVIIPQNVNTTNILFDDNYMVKLLLGPVLDQDDPIVQGIMGYLGPEFLRSNTLAEKVNVYSFGVVLAELLTSQRAFNFDRPEAERSLATVLATAVESGTLHRILDDEILKEGNIEMMEKVADLAFRCLRIRGADRPSMKQVAMELEGLRIMAKHPGGMVNFSESSQKTDPLVTPSDPCSVLTNAEAMGCRRLQQVDYFYLT